MIPQEARWWRENQNRTQRVQIAARVVGAVDYDLITQRIWGFVGAWPTPVQPQFQSPTFPSSQPVVVEWALAGVASLLGATQALSAIGFPTALTHSMEGDPLTANLPQLRCCVIVAWTYQGQVQSQICDANTAQLAIGLADSVSLAFVAQEPGDISIIPMIVSVYPGRGRSTAKISTDALSLHNGGPPIPSVIPVQTWARVERWRWFWSSDPNVPALLRMIEVRVSRSGGFTNIARWLDAQGAVAGPPALAGSNPVTAADRWEPWVPSAETITITPGDIGLDWCVVVAEIRSEV